MENGFPERLRSLRKREGISQTILSHQCGLSDAVIQKYECGEMKPGMDSLIAMADHFQVSIDYLVGRKNY